MHNGALCGQRLTLVSGFVLFAILSSGTFWKAATPVTDNKNYMEDVMARVEKRIAKSNAIAAVAGAGGQSQRGAAAAAPVSSSAAAAAPPASSGSNKVNLAATQQRPIVAQQQRTGSANSSSCKTTTDGLAATLKSSYVPPPKNAVSANSAPRPQQQQQQQRKDSNGATSARSSAGSVAASSSPAVAPAAASGGLTGRSGGSGGGGGSSSFVNPADDESRSAAPGSLLDGHFDEQENKRAFEEARKQWMAESTQQQQDDASSSAAASGGAKSKVQLVHDPDYSPAELATGSVDGGIGSGMGGGSLLDGPAFNEAESKREFAEARRAWMQSVAEAQSAAAPTSATARKPRAQHTAADAADNSDGMWNPATALGAGGSVLFPTESDYGAADAHAHAHAPPAVSSALRSAQSALENSAKHSCYQCYKLFYANAALSHDARNEVDFPGKAFCSPECLAQATTSTKIRCAGRGCPKSILISEGTRAPPEQGGHLMCHSCAGNGGVAVPPPLPTSPSPPLPAMADGDEDDDDDDADDASTGAVIPAASSSPEPEQAQAPAAAAVAATSVPAAAAATSIGGAASLSRPSTAQQRAVLDTSVIRQAPPAPSAQPVIEFPSDDED
jgi:hypothetical protein